MVIVKIEIDAEGVVATEEVMQVEEKSFRKARVSVARKMKINRTRSRIRQAMVESYVVMSVIQQNI